MTDWLARLKEIGEKDHAGPEFIFFARNVWDEIVAVIDLAQDAVEEHYAAELGWSWQLAHLQEALAALKKKIEEQ